jgi:DNA-binding beta-propeller fold protein YncE
MTGRQVCLAFLLVLALSPSKAWAEDPPLFLLEWGTLGNEPGQFEFPIAVAVDRAGTVYVADASTSRIQVFTSTGGWIREWQIEGMAPSGLAVDSNGNVFVAASQNFILKYTGNGVLLTQWGGGGANDGAFNGPSGIAVDAGGNVYVADRFNGRVQKFTNDGVFVTKWGTAGIGVATDGAGFVYVTDQDNRRVVKFTDNGGFVTQWTSDPDFYPSGVTIDAEGNVVVLELMNDRVQKFTSAGAFLTQWGGFGSGDGEFDFPFGIAADAAGDVFIADSGNSRIQKFGPATTPTARTTWGRIKAAYR